MKEEYLERRCQSFIKTLCEDIPERCIGSKGNKEATDFFRNEMSILGWETDSAELDVIEWKESSALLVASDKSFNVFVSPYSKGCDVTSELTSASSVDELEALHAAGKIILLHGDIAKEQLMPKNFVFYNPEEHKKIIGLLEKSGASAIVCATGRNAATAGGVYPFPLIEDGDFDIPSVYMTEEEGKKLLCFTGKSVYLRSLSQRTPSKSYNVSCRKGSGPQKIVVTAHIDSKKGTPGAIDNATGVAVLLLTAELLQNYLGELQIEIVAFNGEDYYSVPGQMKYIEQSSDKFDKILLNINIDGAGYRIGPSAFSFFDLPENIRSISQTVLNESSGITEGVQWPQGDHSIFVQYGIPAIAVSSKWLIDNMEQQDITHTPKDNPEIVDVSKLVRISRAIESLIRKITCVE